jgi:hypothetical protein
MAKQVRHEEKGTSRGEFFVESCGGRGSLEDVGTDDVSQTSRTAYAGQFRQTPDDGLSGLSGRCPNTG